MTEFTENLPIKPESAMVTAESSRAIQEVQASLIIAKKFPRDENLAYTKMMSACTRVTLAEQAIYTYPRGGKTVSGATIRLAEVLIRYWGNADSGVRELSQENGVSEVEAFCWDKESNVREVKTFRVPHKIKARGTMKTLTDSRDIYELVANMGARRRRACILGIIPGDIVDAALSKCRETLTGSHDTPLTDRIRKMLEKFDEKGVSKEMIEKRLGHNVSAIIENQLVDLIGIFNSLKDGMSKREDWFDMPNSSPDSDDLTEKIKGTKKAPKKDNVTKNTEKVEVPDNIDEVLGTGDDNFS